MKLHGTNWPSNTVLWRLQDDASRQSRYGHENVSGEAGGGIENVGEVWEEPDTRDRILTEGLAPSWGLA